MEIQVGDMVWGNVKSHPWWPGEIYNEAFASRAVHETKKEGYVLVAFYGDYTYSWLDPAELIPFDLHYEEKSKQTNAADFLKAVDHAFYEVQKRAALGLACHCRNPSTFQPTNVEGFVKVDVCGYDPGALYSTDQIKTARNGFQPLGILSFIKKLASSPTNNVRRDIDLMKNEARFLAYRAAVFEEFDETYAQAFGVKPIHPGNSVVVSIDHGNALTQAPVPLGSSPKKLHNLKKNNKNLLKRRDEQNVKDSAAQSNKSKAQVKSKHSTKRVKVNETEKKDGDLLLENRASLVAPNSEVNAKKTAKGASSTVGKKEKETIAMDKKPTTVAKVSSFDEPTMLFIKFPHGARLPSVSELKAKFARFGALDESSARVYWKSSTCRLVFLRKSDAESAYNYAVNGTMFGERNVGFRLIELECSSQNVLTNSCLKNPNSVGSTSASTVDPHGKSTQGEYRSDGGGVKSYMCGYESIEQFVDAVNMKHLQLKEMNSHNNRTVATASTGSVDISAQMTSLLKRCSDIVADIKRSSKP